MGRNSVTFVLVLLVSGQPTPAVAQLQLHVEEMKGTEFKTGTSGTLSPDGKIWVHMHGGYGELWVFDSATEKLLASKKMPSRKSYNPSIDAPVFSPDGTLFAYIATSSQGDATADFVSLWDTTTWKQSAVLRVKGALRLEFSPDGRTLAVQTVGAAGLPNSICFWELNGAKGARERAVLTSGQSRPCYSPDGKLFFNGGAFLNTETEEPLVFPNEDGQRGYLPEGVSRLSHVAISPDSKLFFATVWGRDNKGLGSSFRDMKTGKVVRSVEFQEVGKFQVLGKIQAQPDGKQWASMFSPDGKLLALVYSGYFLLIDVGTGKHLASIEGSPVKFAKDSKSLLGVGKTGPVTWELTWKPQPSK